MGAWSQTNALPSWKPSLLASVSGWRRCWSGCSKWNRGWPTRPRTEGPPYQQHSTRQRSTGAPALTPPPTAPREEAGRAAGTSGGDTPCGGHGGGGRRASSGGGHEAPDAEEEPPRWPTGREAVVAHSGPSSGPSSVKTSGDVEGTVAGGMGAAPVPRNDLIAEGFLQGRAAGACCWRVLRARAAGACCGRLRGQRHGEPVRRLGRARGGASCAGLGFLPACGAGHLCPRLSSGSFVRPLGATTARGACICYPSEEVPICARWIG